MKEILSAILLLAMAQGPGPAITGALAGSSPSGNTLRATSINTSLTTSVVIALPTGSAAGDLAVLFTGATNTISNPSGWTVLSNAGTQSWWTEAVFSKVLTSGDISTGSVTVTQGGAGSVVASMADFVGATGGVRETDIGYIAGSSPSTFNVPTSSAVVTTDVILISANGRVTGFPTSNLGTLQQRQLDGGGIGGGSLYFDNSPAGGVNTITCSYPSYSNPGFSCQVVVVEN